MLTVATIQLKVPKVALCLQCGRTGSLDVDLKPVIRVRLLLERYVEVILHQLQSGRVGLTKTRLRAAAGNMRRT